MMVHLLDPLIQPALRARASPDELRRLRLIAGVSACLGFEILGFGALLARAMPPASVLCIGAFGASVTTVLVRLRVFGTARGAGSLLWLSLLALAAFSAFHENSQWAFMSPVLGIVVLLAMTLDGARAAVTAAGLSIATTVLVVAVHEAGLQLPPFAAGIDVLGLTATNAVFTVAGLTFLAWLNHSLRQQAYAELGDALARARASEAARERAEAELRLAQKLEAVGRLAAGVAHEINTPVQFVGASVEFVGQALHDLSVALAEYQKLEAAAAAGPVPPSMLAELRRVRDELDLAYALDEAPAAVERAREGVARVNKIVSSMRVFAHRDKDEPEDVDLNRAIENTLVIAAGEYKHVADLETSYGALPPVRCLAGELNQVVLNLVVNAAHAIADKYRGTQGRGHLTVKTWLEGDVAVIAVGDDGCGIPEAVQPRIFDPFFTTKEVGRGTGQGLAIARSVVVKGHGGSLKFATEPGVGTTFYVRLPVGGPALRLVA